MLLEFFKEGTTIVVSSHNLDEIDRLTNTIYFMKDGAILKESLEELAEKQYFISVNDVKKGEEVLSGQNLSYTVNNQQQIVIEEANVSIQTAIEQLNGNNVKITAIENERIGAERRYLELYERDTGI